MLCHGPFPRKSGSWNRPLSFCWAVCYPSAPYSSRCTLFSPRSGPTKSTTSTDSCCWSPSSWSLWPYVWQLCAHISCWMPRTTDGNGLVFCQPPPPPFTFMCIHFIISFSKQKCMDCFRHRSILVTWHCSVAHWASFVAPLAILAPAFSFAKFTRTWKLIRIASATTIIKRRTRLHGNWNDTLSHLHTHTLEAYFFFLYFLRQHKHHCAYHTNINYNSLLDRNIYLYSDWLLWLYILLFFMFKLSKKKWEQPISVLW